MIYASAGIKDVTENGDLKIVTIGCDDVRILYKEGYEVFAHSLKILCRIEQSSRERRYRCVYPFWAKRC